MPFVPRRKHLRCASSVRQKMLEFRFGLTSERALNHGHTKLEGADCDNDIPSRWNWSGSSKMPKASSLVHMPSHLSHYPSKFVGISAAVYQKAHVRCHDTMRGSQRRTLSNRSGFDYLSRIQFLHESVDRTKPTQTAHTTPAVSFGPFGRKRARKHIFTAFDSALQTAFQKQNRYLGSASNYLSDEEKKTTGKC